MARSVIHTALEKAPLVSNSKKSMVHGTFVHSSALQEHGSEGCAYTSRSGSNYGWKVRMTSDSLPDTQKQHCCSWEPWPAPRLQADYGHGPSCLAVPSSNPRAVSRRNPADTYEPCEILPSCLSARPRPAARGIAFATHPAPAQRDGSSGPMPEPLRRSIVGSAPWYRLTVAGSPQPSKAPHPG